MTNFLMRLLFVLFLTGTSFASQSTSKAPQGFIVAQYYGIWTEPGQAWEQKFRADTPFTKLNRLYLAFGKIIKGSDGHYTIDFDGDAAHVKQIMARMKSVNPTAEIFLSVLGDLNGEVYRGAANDPLFAENLAAFLSGHGLNGFDIDWEEGINRADLNRLVTNLSAVLHARGMKLTLAVWQMVVTGYDMPLLREKLDQINIMSYGTGLSLQTCAEQYVSAGFPANKIIGGIETETGYHNFSGVTDTLDQAGTIAEKTQYAISHGLAGMMEWRLDNDYAPKDNLNHPTYQGANLLWQLTYGDTP
jgi:GH18 family chitinase